jgi:hypothetical protein
MTDPKPRLRPEAVYEQRTELVKQMLAKESAAQDAKTARLKALRLARDAALAESPAEAQSKPGAKPKAKRKRQPG